MGPSRNSCRRCDVAARTSASSSTPANCLFADWLERRTRIPFLSRWRRGITNPLAFREIVFRVIVIFDNPHLFCPTVVVFGRIKPDFVHTSGTESAGRRSRTIPAPGRPYSTYHSIVILKAFFDSSSKFIGGRQPKDDRGASQAHAKKLLAPGWEKL